MGDAKSTILVVDDEPIVVDMVQRYLAREGFRVVTAATGPAALAAALDPERPPWLIVLDIMLPDIDGIEICRRLRREAGATMPIILLTARREESERIQGLGVGADDYVVKPFSPAELVARVKAQLRRVEMDTRPPGPMGACAVGTSCWTPRPAAAKSAASRSRSARRSSTCSTCRRAKS